jgi:hypothetical protein
VEHRLIRGGEQWLPFARSRIKALKATGQPYASQKFDIDGTLISVSIEPGHEYIDISGGGKCTFKMDSGVIEVRNVNPENSLSYEAGTYYDTARTSAYNTAFTTLSDDGKWLTKPTSSTDNGFSGQLSGDVTYSKGFRGAIPANRIPPASFAPLKLKEKNEDGTDKYEAQDGALVAKKISAAKFPASCWTGRMRLYVQAMYGRPLYKYAKDGEGTQDESCAAWEGESPGLSIKGYAEKKDAPPGSAIVDASAGVILLDDGTHWLVAVETKRLRFYPLRGSKCAESARKVLGQLSETERGHLEAYILSTCRPVISEMQIVSYEAGEFTSSMGYGYHWNWSGSAADIVINIEEVQSGLNMRLASTHWRITPTSAKTSAGKRVWSAEAKIVEGPVVWTVLRSVWSVHYPVWGVAKGSAKLFPRYSILASTADAPFYVFYKGDDLQVCRYSRKSVPAGPVRRDGTTWGGQKCSPSYFVCEGDRPSYYNWTDAGSAYSDVTFQIGGTKYSTVPYGLTASGTRGEFSGGSAPAPHDEALVFATGPFVNILTDSVQPVPNLGYPTAYRTEYLLGPAQYTQGWIGDIVMDTITSSISESSMGYAMVIIPFYDAEAIYYHNWEHQDRISTGRQKTHLTSKSNAVFSYAYRGGVRTDTYLSYVFGPSGPNTIVHSVTSEPDSTDVIKDSTKQVLHCGGGELTTLSMYGSVNDFTNLNEDIAPAYFTTRTSAAGGSDATVFADFINPPKNTTLTNPTLPVIVGWA